MALEMVGINKHKVLNMSGFGNVDENVICYQPSSITSNGVWQDQKPLNYSLPLFILQMIIIVITTQVVIIILKPFQQPRVVSEITAGILLGPSGFGAISWIGEFIFPLKSIMVFETMANIGLLYYMFLVGVEMDVSLVKQSTRETIAIVAFNSFLPVALYTGIMIVLTTLFGPPLPLMGILFHGITYSVTAFPVISRILVELKLFNTELGKKAMTAAIVIDLCAWFLLSIVISWAETRDDDDMTLYLPILGIICFTLFCIFVIRPAIMLIIKGKPEGENFDEFYICLILTGVMICGFITDVIGTHFVFGAFIFGLIIPNGPLGTALLEKLEDFVTTLLLPLFFTRSGFRLDIRYKSKGPSQRHHLIFVHVFAFTLSNVAKVLGTFLVGMYFDMQVHESLSLGLLMNTKGLIEMILLTVALEKKIIYPITYTISVICIMVETAIATPAIAFLYKTSRRVISYKRTTLQNAKMDAELKILMCVVHTHRNVPAMVNLIKASHATMRSPIYLYAVHLVELTSRASSMLIVHNAAKSSTKHNPIDSTFEQSENIVKAFENYAQHVKNVTIQLLTAISPYPTMHEDICNLATDKRTTLIIVPFHKQQTVDGGMESINPAFRRVNQHVLANAPCSVCILIDRGLGESASHVPQHIAVIFIGGRDDREALAYGWRMAETPGVNLTVVRFVSGDNIKETKIKQTYDDETLKVIKRELQLDDEYIGNFRLKTMGQEAIMYKEETVNNAEETVTTIFGMDNISNFYIVGREQGIQSTLLAGLNEFSDSPELGALGDLLASSDFAANVSILVVQQYVGERRNGNEIIPTGAVNQFVLDIK